MEESTLLPTLESDILLHIFHKLPIKSLHKCKSVCKEWFSLISDPFFKSNYNSSSIPNHPLSLIMTSRLRNRHKNHLFSLAYEINTITTTTTTTPLAGRRPQPLPWTFTSLDNVFILGSCNGLVALYRHPGDFYLYNPNMVGKKILVHSPMNNENFFEFYCAIFGLCYNSVNDVYKAVFCCLRDCEFFNFYVVNFKNGSWKLKTQPLAQKLRSWKHDGAICGTVVNGVPYWAFTDFALGYFIFYFDLKMEEFKEAPKVPNGKRIWGLGTLDGQLTASLKSDVGLEVWGLKEDDCCWSMLFVVTNKLRSLSTLTWMVKEVEVLIDVNENELMIYNVRDGSLRRVQKRMRRSLYNIVVYFPSFFF